jgi:hypothetical protein
MIILDAIYMQKMNWLCVLSEDKGEIHIFDAYRGGDVITFLKSARSMTRYTALESIRGEILVTASSDCQLKFYQPDIHNSAALKLVN